MNILQITDQSKINYVVYILNITVSVNFALVSRGFYLVLWKYYNYHIYNILSYLSKIYLNTKILAYTVQNEHRLGKKCRLNSFRRKHNKTCP